VTGGKPIAVLLQSISGLSAINPLVAFYDIHGGKERCYSFILSRTPHETYVVLLILLGILICLLVLYSICSHLSEINFKFMFKVNQESKYFIQFSAYIHL
jgi:hypothetical protein